MNLAQLRATAVSVLLTITSFTLTDVGKEGPFVYDPSGTIKSDKDCMALVVGEKKFKRHTSVVTPTYFYAVGTGGANDREALRAAINASQGKTLIIDRVYHVAIADSVLSDPIELPSNTTIRFQGAGKIVLTNDHLPLFWAVEKKNITVSGLNVEYAGVHELAFNATPAAQFSDKRMKVKYPNLSWTGPAAMMSVFHFRGCENVRMVNNRFYAQSNLPERYFALGIFIGDGQRKGGPNSTTVTTLQKNTVVQNSVFDGMYMPILSAYCNGLVVKDITSLRYSTLPLTGPDNLSTSGWFPPPHIIYNSGRTDNFVLENVYDAGIDGGGGNWGQCSVKALRLNTFRIANITSFRNHGCMDFSGANGTIENVNWKGDATIAKAGYNGVNPVRWLENPDANQENVYISNVFVTDVSTTYNDRLFSMPAWNGGGPYRCTLKNVNLVQEVWPFTNASNPYFYPDRAENCDFEVNLTLRTPFTSFTPFLWRIGTGTNNRITGRIRGFQTNAIRAIGTIPGNVVELQDMDAKSVLRLSNGTMRREGKSVVRLNCTAGATALTATGVIPAGCVITGVSTNIETAVGTSRGYTGYRVGVSGALAKYGSRSGTTGSTTLQSYTKSPELTNSAKDVIITAIGGAFDGTGIISITVDYMQNSQSSEVK